MAIKACDLGRDRPAPDPVRSKHRTRSCAAQSYPEKCARLSKSSSPGAIRMDASLRVAFFVWPTSITEFSNGLAAMRRRSGARSGKRFSRCNTCSGARRAAAIGEPWIAGKGRLWDRRTRTGRTSPRRFANPGKGVDTYRIHKMMAARVMTGHKRRIALVKPRQLAVCCCSGATWVAKEQP